MSVLFNFHAGAVTLLLLVSLCPSLFASINCFVLNIYLALGLNYCCSELFQLQPRQQSCCQINMAQAVEELNIKLKCIADHPSGPWQAPHGATCALT